MKAVRHIREELGLSQRDLAGLLGISKSHIDNAEKAIREFDNTTFLKLELIEGCIQASNKTSIAKARSCPIEMRKYCRKKELDYRYMLAVMEKKLDKMKASNEQVTRLMNVLDLLEGDEDTIYWVQFLKCKHGNKLQACNDTAIEVLQAKIDLLTAEAGVLKKYMQENP